VCVYYIHYATHTRNAATLLAERGFATPPHDRAGLEPHTRTHESSLSRMSYVYYNNNNNTCCLIFFSFFYFVGDPQRSRLWVGGGRVLVVQKRARSRCTNVDDVSTTDRAHAYNKLLCIYIYMYTYILYLSRRWVLLQYCTCNMWPQRRAGVVCGYFVSRITQHGTVIFVLCYYYLLLSSCAHDNIILCCV